jgi:hypothetical protein
MAKLASNEKAIKEAIAKLDAKNDKHWNSDGSPNLDAIRTVMKNSEIEQVDLNSAADGFTRPSMAKKLPSQKELAKRKEDELPADLVDEETGRFNLENEDGTRRKIFVRNREVAAIERGFASGAIRDPGDVFIFTGELGTWMMDPTHANRAVVKAEADAAREKALKPDPVKASD